MHTDLLFQIISVKGEIRADHGYSLFSAISRIVEAAGDQWLHSNPTVGLHTIRGLRSSPGKIMLGDSAAVGLRIPEELVSKAVRLAGKKLSLQGDSIRLGISRTRPLAPAPVLYSRLVTTKNGMDEGRFDQEIARQMKNMDVQGEVTRIETNRHPQNDSPKGRKIISIRGKKVVGYALLVKGLSDAESIRLQENGLGGRRRMGCGVFVPAPPSLSGMDTS